MERTILAEMPIATSFAADAFDFDALVYEHGRFVVNVGVSINCSVKDAGDNPKLDLKLEISDALPPAKDSDAITFRKVSINSRASLSLGKPTTVSITEDPGSRHRFQVDVTATKLK
jgi:hypothetical protein